MKYESNIELRAEIIKEGVETTMGETVKGYKVFEPDWTCRSFQYSCPGVFEMDEEPIICEQGFHFCRKLSDCFSYYDFDPNNKVAEVEALGEIEFNDYDSKCCTNKISIIRELSWEEVLYFANTGRKCYGHGNSGNWNEGDLNTGSGNVGYKNTGDLNIGFSNSGNRNVGCENVGDNNMGNRNFGQLNYGDCNVGCHNTGHFNTGDWNTASHCSGCFMTEEQPFMMFNKPTTDMTFTQWTNCRAHNVLNSLFCSPVCSTSDPTIDSEIWGKSEDASQHSEITNIGLAKVDPRHFIQKRWDDLDDEDKQCVLDLPNFDKYIFYECTGIRVD